MTKLTRIVALVALVAALFTPLAHADNYGQLANFIFRGQPSGGAISAVSTEVPIILKYLPTSTDKSGTVAVAAGGDITFKRGASGSEVADDSLECPVSGALGGVIDVSDTACDTMGEVCDIINGSSYWRCVLMDSLRTDSSDDRLITLSETANPTRAEGVGLLADSTVALTVTRAITPCRDFTCGYISQARNSTYGTLVANPWAGSQSVLWKSTETITTGGTATFNIYSVLVNNATLGSETATLLWTAAGGASTAEASSDWTTSGLFSKRDQKMVVRVTATSTLTVAKFANNAITWPYALP